MDAVTSWFIGCIIAVTFGGKNSDEAIIGSQYTVFWMIRGIV
jgi:hypothetical protein